MVFAIFVSFIVLLRIGELSLSRRNERWLLQHGAVEYGQRHYPWMVVLHVLFFVSLIAEYCSAGAEAIDFYLLALYFVLPALKAWTILSLGKFWNTKIYRIPDFPLVRSGPYKYFKHPNYAIVVAEIAVIPLVFRLWHTALVFSILNAVMLAVRIREENRALKA